MDPKDQDIICLFRVTDVSSGPIKDISYLLTFLTPFLHIEIIGYWWEYYRIISLSISVAFLYIIELNLRQVYIVNYIFLNQIINIIYQQGLNSVFPTILRHLLQR